MAALALIAAACGADTASDTSGPAATTPATETPATDTPPPTTTTSLHESDDAASTPAPGSPPEVDVSAHSVPLDAIHFDTFDGGSVTLEDSTPELRARLLDAIPPIDDPQYGDSTAGDWLEPTDLVMGYVTRDKAFAYPFKILNFHEIVIDEIDGVPVLISYCPLCRSAIVYDRRLGDTVLTFGNTSALYESDMVMVDRETGSYWWQVAGSAIVGPLTGSTMDALPSSVATWEDWVSRHPTTLVLTRETGFDRPYERDSFANYVAYLDSGRFAFPVDEAALDDRLPASTFVIGVSLPETTVAYVVDGLASPINDTVAGASLVIFPTEGGATAFRSTVNGVPVEFQPGADGTFVDVATGSVWTSTGMSVSGEHEGIQLEALPARTTFWFALVGAFPGIDVRAGLP